MVADALSRVGHLMALRSVLVATPKWIQEILNSYHSDAVAQNRLQALTIKSPDENGYYLDNGVIKYNNHIWWCRCLAAKSA